MKTFKHEQSKLFTFTKFYGENIIGFLPCPKEDIEFCTQRYGKTKIEISCNGQLVLTDNPDYSHGECPCSRTLKTVRFHRELQ